MEFFTFTNHIFWIDTPLRSGVRCSQQGPLWPVVTLYLVFKSGIASRRPKSGRVSFIGATGLDHTTVTTTEGQYSLQDIPLGLYKVQVTASGFPTYTIDKVEVIAGTIYTLNIQLKMGQQTTTVEVSAAAVTMDTTTQTQSMTIAEDVVQNVPLNGRDFTQLIAVAPGFGGYNVGGFGSMNGTRANQNNWQIDGVDNNDFWHNIPAVNQGGVSGIAGVVLPVDAIDEFSSQTQSGAESGRNAGGTVNLIIKSGGNTIHGSAYY